MKLQIDIQIKDGRQIVSRETKGYKVLINRIQKEFSKLTIVPNRTIKLIIQTSKAGAENKTQTYFRTQGNVQLKKGVVNVWTQNCIKRNLDGSIDEQFTTNRILEVIAHEFGHLWDYENRGSKGFFNQGTHLQELFADSFAAKMMKTELSCKSATGKTKYARVRQPRKG